MSLDWPAGFPRTAPDERTPYREGSGFSVSRAEAFDAIKEQLERMADIHEWRIETAVPHTAKAPHRPYSDRDPDDPGVVAYFVQNGRQHAVPCDRWSTLRDNARAIALYLDAKRGMDRWGVATVGGEFATAALPAAANGNSRHQAPHELLGVAPDAPGAVVKAAARELIKENHPDQGGDGDRLEAIKDARDAMLDNGGEQA